MLAFPNEALKVNIGKSTSQTSLSVDFQSFFDVVDQVKNHSSGVDCYSTNGQTQLHMAIIGGNMNVATELLDRGADVNLPVLQTGQTPLMLCTIHDRLNIMEYFLKCCHLALNVNAVDLLGNTAVSYACMYDRLLALEMLVSHKANTHIVNFSAYTPLMIACRFGSTEIVQYLLQNGSSIFDVEISGFSTYDIAVLELRYDILCCIRSHINSSIANGTIQLHDLETFIHSDLDMVEEIQQWNTDSKTNLASQHTSQFLDISTRKPRTLDSITTFSSCWKWTASWQVMPSTDVEGWFYSQQQVEEATCDSRVKNRSRYWVRIQVSDKLKKASSLENCALLESFASPDGLRRPRKDVLVDPSAAPNNDHQILQAKLRQLLCETTHSISDVKPSNVHSVKDIPDSHSKAKARARKNDTASNHVVQRQDIQGDTQSTSLGTSVGSLPEVTVSVLQHESRPNSELSTKSQSESIPNTCSGCTSKFSFFTRRRECRLCDKTFCVSCVPHQSNISRYAVDKYKTRVLGLRQPEESTSHFNRSVDKEARLCSTCNKEIRQFIVSMNQRRLNTKPPMTAKTIGLSSSLLHAPSLPNRTPSAHTSLSIAKKTNSFDELAYCPVCNISLQRMGAVEQKEHHVMTCLEGSELMKNKKPGFRQSHIYRAHVLESDLAQECTICYEFFLKGQQTVTTGCLCQYHRACLDSWLIRGQGCPLHCNDVL